MENIGVISYAVGAVVFLITALVLMTGQRNRPHKNALMLASWVSALWMGLTALTTHGNNPAFLSYLLEPLRDLFLLVFVVRVLSAAYTDAKESSAYFRRTVSMLSGFTLFLTTLVMYRGVSGSASTVVAGIDLLFAGFLVMAVIGLALIEQLIRNARPESRRSVKYLCIGLGAIFAYDFYLYSHALLFGGVDPLLWEARGMINAIVVPVIGVAAVRDPQWSLDIFVSRRVVFHTAALLGSGLYLLAMGLGGYFIQQYGGTWGAVAEVIFLFGAVLMLMMLLFSGQLRARLRVFINKHFFHYKFEYREEWLRFIDTLTSSEPDEKLRERTIKALAEVHECPGGALWLYREAGQYRPVASWEIPVDTNGMTVDQDSTLIRYMRDHEWIINCEEYRLSPHTYNDLQLPVWLDRIDDAWLVVPLIFHERLSGFIVLTRPQVTHSMNWEDYDLLRIMARQSAAHLAQLDASQALSQARQFEACSRLSAYVMHDLKNLIAQLSLVVTNAARHKNNPQFMEDAIQTVENSVDKMNRLLAQLRAARDPQENLALVDVCKVLDGAVDMMSAGKPLPSLDCQARGLHIQTDRDRFGAVIGHVIRNAQDATPDDGMVIVRLFKQNDYAVIEVQDTGEGMDEAFIRDRLFQPFDTTKGKSGMGIGAYETREFIRSLAGEVEVLSRVNEGTTFRMRIPISEESKNSVKSPDKSNNGRADDHRLKEIAGY